MLRITDATCRVPLSAAAKFAMLFAVGFGWELALPASTALAQETPTQQISAVETSSQTEDRSELDGTKLINGYHWIFDGKSFNGWEGDKTWFRIEDQAIVAGTLEGQIPKNQFLCTEKVYGDFELQLQVKLKGAGDNAGVQFRSSRIPDDHEVSGYQCDVGTAWNRPVWGGLYDESRRNKMLAEGPKDKLPKWLLKDEWNTLKVRATGKHIEIFLNGHQTIDYTEQDDNIAATGIIGLQIHSGPPTEAWYRAIQIRELSK